MLRVAAVAFLAIMPLACQPQAKDGPQPPAERRAEEVAELYGRLAGAAGGEEVKVRGQVLIVEPGGNGPAALHLAPTEYKPPPAGDVRGGPREAWRRMQEAAANAPLMVRCAFEGAAPEVAAMAQGAIVTVAGKHASTGAGVVRLEACHLAR